MPHLDETIKVKPATQRTSANEENLKTGEVQRVSTTKDAGKLLSLTTMAMKYAPNENGGNSERHSDQQTVGHLHASPPHAIVTGERGGAPSALSQSKQLGQNPITPSPFVGGGRGMAHFGHQMLPGWGMGGPMVIHHSSDAQGLFPSPLRPVPPNATGSDLQATSLATGMDISPIAKPPDANFYYQHFGDQSEGGPTSASNSPEQLLDRTLSRKRTGDDGNQQEPPSKKDKHGIKEGGQASPVSVTGHDDKAGSNKVTSGKIVISPTPSDSDAKEEHRDQASSEKATEQQLSSVVQPFAMPYPYYGHMYGNPAMYPPYFAGYRPMVVMPPTMYPAQPYHMPPPVLSGPNKPKDQFLPPSLDEAAKIPDTAMHLPKPTESSKVMVEDKKKAPKPPSQITSVADWQAAARETGSPPSVGRCVPLKDPVPSHYWGVTGTDAAQNIKLPDFHRLVNFPDYLAKNKMSSRQTGCAPQGKRHCVMCGKLRVCSGAGAPAPDPNAGSEDTLCIIPRQNKGLCTACDVMIWVVVDQAIEIKWCKGCKNFRPWVAFGDKGSATKCVRCRDRQREKYATQKEQLRKRRLRQKLNPVEEEKKEEDQMAAAKGLRNLMSAAL